MGDDGASPRLEALHALLASAQELAHTLREDAIVGRVLRALATLAPDERGILASAIERGAAARRINDAFGPLNGVRLRINPNPRLFVRVVDTHEPPQSLDLEEEDFLPYVLRIMQRISLLQLPEVQTIWRPAVERALDELSPRGRAICLQFVQDVLAIVARRVAADPVETT